MANTIFKLLWNFRIMNFTRVSILSIVYLHIIDWKCENHCKVLRVHISSFKKIKLMTYFYFEIWNKPYINSISMILNSIFVPILFTFTSIIHDVIIERFDVDIDIWKEVLKFPSYRMLRVPVANLSPALGFTDMYILSLVCVRLSYWQ